MTDTCEVDGNVHEKVPGEPTKYYLIVGGEKLEMTCSEGTVFSIAVCSCIGQ